MKVVFICFASCTVNTSKADNSYIFFVTINLSNELTKMCALLQYIKVHTVYKQHLLFIGPCSPLA